MLEYLVRVIYPKKIGRMTNNMKFIYRLSFNLVIFFGLCIPLQIIGIIILLPVCFYCQKTRLPRGLRWFDNADLYVGRDTSVYDSVLQSGWYNNYCWLAWRNPLNYFGYKILGKQVKTETMCIIQGNPNVGNTSAPGLFIQESPIGYQYYYIHKWSQTTCMRLRLGWKFNSNITPGWYQWAFTVQPYMSYTGI